VVVWKGGDHPNKCQSIVYKPSKVSPPLPPHPSNSRLCIAYTHEVVRPRYVWISMFSSGEDWGQVQDSVYEGNLLAKAS